MLRATCATGGPPKTRKHYDERGKCISDEYTQEIPEAGAGVKQNGLLTQGEDTADNGGNPPRP